LSYFLLVPSKIGLVGITLRSPCLRIDTRSGVQILAEYGTPSRERGAEECLSRHGWIRRVLGAFGNSANQFAIRGTGTLRG
jgi:hypothetical protein